MSILRLAAALRSLGAYYDFRIDRMRVAMRIKQGMQVGKNVYIMEEVDIDCTYPYLIYIGDNCRISKDVRILAHDATSFRDVGITRIAPVKILEGTFIGERAVILPGVTIGPRALIAAGSVVNRDIGEDKAAAGNPARPYANYSDILQRAYEAAQSSILINKAELESGSIEIAYIKGAVEKDGVAFIHGMPGRDPYYVNADLQQLRENSRKAYERLQVELPSKPATPALQ
jgi:acetyltransferase-like isoleucine patch superfamily enzyme